MKTLRISDEIHRKLTATVGTLMAQTGKMQTYQDAIEAVLNQSVILPTELLAGCPWTFRNTVYFGLLSNLKVLFC